MNLIAELFVPLVELTTMGLVVAAFRLDRRISRGAINAGPATLEPPTPPGLKQTPWELTVIDDQLGAAGSVSQDLVTTLNRLIDAAKLPDGPPPLPVGADRAQVERLIDRLERHLELAPLAPNDTVGPTGPNASASTL